MTFEYPEFLLLLWLLPLPALFLTWKRRRAIRKASRLVRPVKSGRSVFTAQLILFSAAFAAGVVALARPQWGEREEQIFSSSRNVTVLLDVSRSMLARDVHPDRLRRAKADIIDLASVLSGDRVGLTVFGASPVKICPLTADLAFFLQMLSGVDIDSAPYGETDLGKALEGALLDFEGRAGEHNSIVMVTDGEDLSGGAAKAAEKAGAMGIPIFCVGIGNPAGAAIPDPTGSGNITYRGKEVVTKLDGGTLSTIAEKSGGTYIPLSVAGTGHMTLGDIYLRYAGAIRDRELTEMRETRRIERFQWFLFPSVFCFLFGAGLSRGRPGSGKRRRGGRISSAAAFAFAALGLCQTGTAAEIRSPRDTARRAQSEWRAGNFAESAALYDEALTAQASLPDADPRFTAAMSMNAGLAYLRAGNVSKAAELFKKAGNSAEADAGLGTALYRAAAAVDIGEELAQPTRSAAGKNEEGKPSAAARKLALLEEASVAFQKAFRDLDADPVMYTNLLAAVKDIPELRGQVRKAEAEKKYGGMNPGEIMAALLAKQRKVFSDAAGAFADKEATKLDRLEKAAAEQRIAADIWGVAAGKIMEQASGSTTNAGELAEIKFELDSGLQKSLDAADAMEYTDPEAFDSIRDSEKRAYRFFSALAEPPSLIDEAIRGQTNALSGSVRSDEIRTPFGDQRAAAAVFDRFRQIFPEWSARLIGNGAEGGQPSVQMAAPETPQQQPAGKPPVMTEKDRNEIMRLADDVCRLHGQILSGAAESELLPEASLPLAEEALADMIKIRELLPKPPQQNKQQNQQNKQNQQNQQNQKEEQQQKPPTGTQEEQQQHEDEQDSSGKEQQENEPEPKSAEKMQEDPELEEAEKLMEKVLMLEKEREERRREHNRKIRPRTGERDW